jgi:hypothetical protein
VQASLQFSTVPLLQKIAGDGGLMIVAFRVKLVRMS